MIFGGEAVWLSGVGTALAVGYGCGEEGYNPGEGVRHYSIPPIEWHTPMKTLLAITLLMGGDNRICNQGICQLHLFFNISFVELSKMNAHGNKD